MEKTNKKKQAQRTSGNLTKSAPNIAVHTDSNSHLAPNLSLEPSSAFSVANNSRGTHFIFGPVAGAAAVTALRLAQIETQVQIALQQLATLVTVTVGNRCHNNSEFSATLPPHLVLLSLLNRQQVSARGFNVDSNSKAYRNSQPRLSAAMYHHHSQQQGQQPFSNGPRPPHHQPPPNQHQNRPPSDMLSQVMGFQFPRPTQLPDELESALAIRGARDMDHRLIDHTNRPNQHQNQSSGSGIRQHGNYGSNPGTLTSDNQPGHQQGVDWSSYQPPTKLFASPPPNTSHQSQRHQGPQQQPQSSHVGTSIPNWTAPISDSPSPQAQHPHGGGSGGGGGGGGESQGLYTPESAGSILASFGLSNEDLEVLSHYPDDQLTPDTLPFILRDIQINKSGNQKPVTSSSSSSFSRSIHDMPLPPSRSSPLGHSSSPEVPSLLTVTQTAGKVIDYGHASRAKDENSTRETFKREPLSSERTVKMYPTASSSSSALKVDKAERRQVRLEHTESSKHGDRDYRRTSSDHRKSNRSPGRDFMPSSKSRNLDRDYRHDGPKPRPSSETRSEASSRRSLSSSSGSKPHSSSKKLPTPTMISDFSAASPKVYPHTCSLCHIQCDQEKDWVDHINTVNHTAACRDLRNKYPDWKPNLPSRSGQYGSQASWHPSSPSHSASRSLSCSLSPSPPHRKHRVGPHTQRPHGRLYSPQHHPHHQHHTGAFSRSGVKRPHDDSTRLSADSSRHPSSSKAGHSSKYGPFQSSRTVKSGTKPATKTTKVCTKPTPAKKKKKVVTPASQDSSVADRLVYLTGIPKDASEQEVTDLVGSFGKINNVILMPCSEEESEKGEGQKASVCMVKAEDTQALANSINLSIRDQQITASVAKKPDPPLQSSEANNGKPAPGQDKSVAGGEPNYPVARGEADQKTSDEKGVILITGLPESGWSESDIIKLVQPYGTPSDVIMATQIGKVLVSVPDNEIAQEIVKVHTFIPAKMKDSELKMIHVRQCIGLSTPVALYNLLMGALDPLESPAPVGWSSLLVISNVPSTPSGSSEVQKLVRRFGTVIKTLVLNNMVICEMATAAMALSVYKRFQTFPCIIQNNPLFFSRKADPKASTQTKVISAYLDSSEDTPANGRSSQTAASADEEETMHKDESESPLEGMKIDGDGKETKTRSAEETVCKDEASEENGSNKALKIDTNVVSDSLTAPDTKPKADQETAVTEISTGETVMQTTEEKTCVSASKTENAKTPTGEETKPSTLETPMPELPKVTQEMVKALLVECRTRTAGQPNNSGEQEETQMETEQGEKAVDVTKEPANHTEEEVKKQERERKEREARKEKEIRERKERERRAWEKEERAKKERERNERARREREKREEERREWERRDRERRERKRTYKQSSWRDEQHNSSEEETKKAEEEFDEFPFNMSDFVTVDEVGDVTDLPCSPSPAVPIATTEEGEDDPTSVQQDAAGDTPMEVTTETTLSDAAVTTVKSDEHVSESEAVTVPTAETSADQMSSHLTPSQVPTAAAPPSPASQSLPQRNIPICEPKAPDTKIIPETETTAILDSTTDVEPPSSAASSAPADSSSNSPASQEVPTGTDKDSSLNHNQAKAEEVVSDEVKEQKKTKDEEDKEQVTDPSCFPVRDTADSTKKKLEKETVMGTDSSLPPFDPRNPVGMEFLVPKTGFFCKVCNRFFSGAKEAEINHCKTLKHYDNLQKYLQTTKMTNVIAKPDSS